MSSSSSSSKFKCKICGQKARGIYYGVLSCEACKKFYKRSRTEQKHLTYKCESSTSGGNCVIDRSVKRFCQLCRYMKCVAEGMTLQSIYNNTMNNMNTSDVQSEQKPSKIIDEEIKSELCAVCSAESKGVHFGLITCEGCKGFFRRSIKTNLGARYLCKNNGAGDCELTPDNRSCRFCRYQKCIQVGMSTENSKLGRQSMLFKHELLEKQKAIKSSSGVKRASFENEQNNSVTSPSLTSISQALNGGFSAEIDGHLPVDYQPQAAKQFKSDYPILSSIISTSPQYFQQQQQEQPEPKQFTGFSPVQPPCQYQFQYHQQYQQQPFVFIEQHPNDYSNYFIYDLSASSSFDLTNLNNVS